MRGQPLTLYEREKLEFHLRGKWSIREVAGILHRNHSVLVRELKRNTCSDGVYRAVKAQEYADRRKHKKRKRKLEDDLELQNYVTQMLLEHRWSPDQISGILKSRLEPKMMGRGISHETIYQFIYEGSGRHMGLYQYLRRKHKHRQKRWGRKCRLKAGITLITPIRYRPEEINEKKTFGHWESDSVIFRKQSEILTVQYERTIQLLRFRRLQNKTADFTEWSLREFIEGSEKGLIQSITFDRGTEGATHWKLKQDYGIETYHCNPYCSWQKGGVENMNGLLRQYLPIETNLSQLTDHDLYVIQEEINNRPRKSLGYRTPNQLLELHLSGGRMVH